MSDLSTLKDGTNIKIKRLDKMMAENYSKEIVELWNLIPQSHHTIDDVFEETKHGRHMYAKWQHSLVAMTQSEEIIGFLIGYERQAESNNLYPKDTLYLNSLSIAPTYQGKGLGSLLVKQFINQIQAQKSFFELANPPESVSVQTNAAPWNQSVISFYKNCGFETIGHKDYPNKKDVVMRYKL